MAEEKKELRCVWNMGTDCGGTVEELEMFNKSIKIPVCENHKSEHQILVILHKNKYDIEEVLKWTADKRKEEMLILKLSGLLTDEDTEL